MHLYVAYAFPISQKKCYVPFVQNTFKLKTQYSCYPFYENFSIKIVF